MGAGGDKRWPCAGLWETPMVEVGGDLTTCCLDQHLENKLGNLREAPLADLWHGEKIHAWRIAHAEGRYNESGPYCTRCNWKSAGAMPQHKVLQYLESTGEELVAERVRKGMNSDFG